MSLNDVLWMEKALYEAHKALKFDEVPIGSIIVSENNEIISTGFNHTITSCDPSAHSEIIAIRQACVNLKNHRIPNTTLYVTLEPCMMCLGAIIQARISRVVFGAYDCKKSHTEKFENIVKAKSINHLPVFVGGVMEKDCQELLTRFFKDLRNK